MASAVAALAAAYAERSVEQRRAAIVERANRIVPQGGNSYEHVSEHITVVTLSYELDVYNAPDLRKLIVELISQGRVFLVLDMTMVDGMDSTGTGVLVGALKRVRAYDGGISLVVPHERIHKIFRITGLTKVFPIFDSVDRAVEFLGREQGLHG
ncbi:anti-sigma factor antagonist [Streptomyces sp. NBC_01565]|uniref:anti-sigma factor antagonist n=1 Tax=Streptomyces sp. NBC_01565 TaxID=2975881 RepID=UPI002257B561|nr:anti-sigma factor antagonist [Streptomyces sp. NBC_01565]MCX4546866.1 anti-sigma factor antagonist [Streptomyces sp. NBC_01565]